MGAWVPYLWLKYLYQLLLSAYRSWRVGSRALSSMKGSCTGMLSSCVIKRQGHTLPHSIPTSIPPISSSWLPLHSQRLGGVWLSPSLFLYPLYCLLQCPLRLRRSVAEHSKFLILHILTNYRSLQLLLPFANKSFSGNADIALIYKHKHNYVGNNLIGISSHLTKQ